MNGKSSNTKPSPSQEPRGPARLAKDYNTMKACEKWLGSLAGGTTCVSEMKSYKAEVQELAPVTANLF